MRVHLTTRQVKVATFEIADYRPAPEVLLWENKAFRRAGRDGQYRECMAITLDDSQQVEEVEA